MLSTNASSNLAYLQELQDIGTLVEHLLQLVEDDVVAVGAARVGPHGAQCEVETLAGRVPLDGDGAALGAAVAQHQLAVVVEPHL